MADNTQNSGGQNGQGSNAGDDGRDQNGQSKKIEKETGDPATNIWHKIQQGAAAKEKMGDFKQQLGEPEAVPKKRRRRRRKKKYNPDGVPKKIDQPKQQGQQVKELNEPKKDFALPVNKFDDGDKDNFQEITPFVAEEPQPVVEAIVPNPPVAPINPFDFNPEPKHDSAEPSLPSSTYVNNYGLKSKNGQEPEVKPVNPFDNKETALVQPMMSTDQIVEEEEKESPEDTGESVEFQAVNTGDSVETPKRDDDEKVEKKDDVIEVKAEEIKERKIEPVFPDKEDLWTVLEHAGITKKKLIVFGIIIAILLAGGLFFIFGGRSLFSVAKNNEPVVVIEQSVVTPVIDQRPYDVISSFIFGLEFKPPELIQVQPINSFGDIGGVDSALIFGKIANLKEEQFVEYVKLLEQMNNVYNVDLYSMLNLAVDRRASLNKYLQDLDALINNSMEALTNIQAHLLQLNEQYDVTSQQAALYEAGFSNYVRNYYGQTAYDNLKFFMDTSNQASKIKAQYGAENILKTMFINSLNALRPRYRDVAANTEALIQGVKVFDVKNSSINAIIPIQ